MMVADGANSFYETAPGAPGLQGRDRMRREEGGGCGVRVDVSGGRPGCSAVRGDKKAERLRNKQEMERRCRQIAEANDRSGKRTFRLLGGCSSCPFSPVGSSRPSVLLLFSFIKKSLACSYPLAEVSGVVLSLRGSNM